MLYKRRKVSSSEKNCATCQYWNPFRKIYQAQDAVFIDAMQPIGQCIGGGFDEFVIEYQSLCDKWSKRSGLK